MTTRFTRDNIDFNAVATGYEGVNFTGLQVPSCGIEDLDKAVFSLFNDEIPLFYELEGERKRIPVIFATGERFAILRKKKPLRDRSGALILPLISISRSGIEQSPPKGVADNAMLPHVIKRRLSENDLHEQQLQNKENLENVKNTLAQEEGLTKVDSTKKNLSLIPIVSSQNIYEIIEMPPINYIGATYEIAIWTNFQQEANRIFETIIKSYTINASNQFRLDSPDKPYWFSGFINSQINTDTSFTDMTENERYVKMTLTMTANGYVILPNMMGGKTALRSFISAPNISFDVTQDQSAVLPLHGVGGPIDNTFDSHIFDDLQAEDDPFPSLNVGVNSLNNQINLLTNRPGYIAQNDTRDPNNTDATRQGIYNVSRIKGETAYRGTAAQNILLNINNKKTVTINI
jgi:hypothetical protein